MSEPQECRRKSDDALARAFTATTPDERSALISEAVYWHAQAQEAERADLPERADSAA
jgi:hypothetical protein